MEKGEEQIRRAIEDGLFENLSGKGKPLHLEDNPYEDPDWHLANKILKDAGFSLPWIEKRKEIEARLAAARTSLGKAHARRKTSMECGQSPGEVGSEWRRCKAVFETECAELNKLIFAYNLEAPTPQVQRLAINIEAEIQRIIGQDEK